MDIDNKKEIVSVNATLAEWLHLIDLIDLACVDLNNKTLSEKLHKLSYEILGKEQTVIEVPDDRQE